MRRSENYSNVKGVYKTFKNIQKTARFIPTFKFDLSTCTCRFVTATYSLRKFHAALKFVSETVAVTVRQKYFDNQDLNVEVNQTAF